jgi:hypothetical protein
MLEHHDRIDPYRLILVLPEVENISSMKRVLEKEISKKVGTHAQVEVTRSKSAEDAERRLRKANQKKRDAENALKTLQEKLEEADKVLRQYKKALAAIKAHKAKLIASEQSVQNDEAVARVQNNQAFAPAGTNKALLALGGTAAVVVVGGMIFYFVWSAKKSRKIEESRLSEDEDEDEEEEEEEEDHHDARIEQPEKEHGEGGKLEDEHVLTMYAMIGCTVLLISCMFLALHRYLKPKDRE